MSSVQYEFLGGGVRLIGRSYRLSCGNIIMLVKSLSNRPLSLKFRFGSRKRFSKCNFLKFSSRRNFYAP